MGATVHLAEGEVPQTISAFAGKDEGSLLAVRYCDPTQQILLLEQEYDCDLIVMGKHGSEFENYLLGSVTKHVLTESQGDVLVVSRQELQSLDNLLFI
ncbi:universal stress protein [Propionivibrio limicola]|uniref:universal stress protein n=1 Tax=Propionivibrio limicola TaxID=167645 RepID=UPI0012916178|nr:universal stress protein [Propionivibrio limicola]